MGNKPYDTNKDILPSERTMVDALQVSIRFVEAEQFKGKIGGAVWPANVLKFDKHLHIVGCSKQMYVVVAIEPDVDDFNRGSVILTKPLRYPRCSDYIMAVKQFAYIVRIWNTRRDARLQNEAVDAKVKA